MGYTPMLEQYITVKASHQDAILFFRLGDFYEMFFEDALLASRELEITLTGRGAGEEGRVPMCGVPYHAADTYITRLIGKGYKVAICEQVEDPAVAKGIVRREVVRVITPGTLLESNSLEEKRHNFLVSIYPLGMHTGLAAADISTGKFQATQLAVRDLSSIMDELARFSPPEVLLPRQEEGGELEDAIKGRLKTIITYLPDDVFQREEAAKTISSARVAPGAGGGIEKYPLAMVACGALLQYMKLTQGKYPRQLTNIQIYSAGDFMLLDSTTLKNLEISASSRDGLKRGTLLWVLDHTKTAMGGRMLKTWLEQPLVKAQEIKQRLDAVGLLTNNLFIRHEIKGCLTQIYDLERLISRAVYGSANARDLVALRESIAILPKIKDILSQCSEYLLDLCRDNIDTLEDIYLLLKEAIADSPPLSVKEGDIIRDGFNQEVDRLRQISRQGKSWVSGIEATEREKTGIKTLKIGFNRVFGYYLEVSKNNINNVPEHYVRKQTLANCERYITQELKEIENQILGAQDRLVSIEYSLFKELRETIADSVHRIQQTANSLATLDALASLAEAAVQGDYSRPQITGGNTIEIRDGLHPVIEKIMGRSNFVANDLKLGGDTTLILITGPNMAGKSTYMRQAALLVLMAQAGSFIPAREAQIGVVDRIFTRVGAADDLAAGQSTFMVEMKECQLIVNEATPKSLILMDEVGRGTSTYDGISIARALLEHIVKNIGARSLFSTHYHELTDLDKIKGVANFTVAVREENKNIFFLRRVVPGRANRSYGIHVAALAGLPESIIIRAQGILQELETLAAARQKRNGPVKLLTDKEMAQTYLPLQANNNPEKTEVLKIIAENNIINELININIGATTPLEAINALARWQEEIKVALKNNTM